MHASTSVLLVMSPLNALLSYILTHKTSFGFLGAPLSIATTYYLSFILISLYARYGPAPPPEAEDDPIGNTSPIDSSDHSTTSSTITPYFLQESNETNVKKFTRGHSTRMRDILSPAALWGFTRLALPGILMVATEWWAFEIVALAAGRLGRLPLAAQGVVMTADQSKSPSRLGCS